MYRTQIKSLKEWKISASRKPLIFLGARQVGKTWLIQEFGKTEYKQMAYINFEHPNAPTTLFETDFDIKRIVTILNAYCHMKITETDTLIVFDEIQSAPKGIMALKYFYENAPQYHVIAAGSLLGINIHPDESFPVGKVDFMELFPMTFVEFLVAMGEENLAEMIENSDMQDLSYFHSTLTTMLKYYFFVGGMPEAVAEFTANRDWTATRNIQESILQSYKRDFSKHAPSDILPRINMVWESIPAQLAKENKKFVYGVVKEGARAKDYELAIQWLTDCGLLHRVNNVTKPQIPLAAYKDLAAFKLYHNDIGLLAAMTGVSATTILEGDNVMTEFKGAMAEQFVFQQLRTHHDLRLAYFTFDNSKYEIDFLLQTPNDEIVPVEVKSGTSIRARSFRLYCERYAPKSAFRLSLNGYQQESWMTNIPLYAAGGVQALSQSISS